MKPTDVKLSICIEMYCWNVFRKRIAKDKSKKSLELKK